MRPWFLLLALTGCWRLDCGDPKRILLPEDPFNLANLNSPFEDWNCGAPWDTWESGGSFLFSTNRKSGGGTFDVHPTAVRFDNERGFAADTAASSWAVRGIADRINTPDDELGPTFVFPEAADEVRKEPAALVFSRGRGGNHDLVALSPEAPPAVFAGLSAFQDSLVEVRLDPLNTSADEGYATWSRETGTIYFHSDRDGRYAIYRATVPGRAGGIAAWLRNPDTAGVRISRVPELASDGQERCPFLRGNTLYFISDRAGGQGGFDIYRSRWDGSAWSAPENLGPRINSASNEYRPVAFALYAGGEEGLLFSSDRPGGKGGYDLYTASAASAP